MIRLEILPGVERVWPENPFGTDRLLYHQWQTVKASREASLILNTFPTGVGKTRAALLALAERHAADDCLFIVPTNELLAQHERDVRAFCAEHGLPHVVFALTAESLASLKGNENLTGSRGSERLVQLLADPRSAFSLPNRRPLLVLTNPDLFYLQLFLRFNRLDRRQLFRTLFHFRYLIVDEFHYYNPKQFANFLFFLGFLREYGYFDDGQQVCLLSATPHPRVHDYLDRLGLSLANLSPLADHPDLPTTPTSAPIHLRLFSTAEVAGLDEVLVAGELSEVARRIERGEHGAVISGALWRINQIHDSISQAGLADRSARLTGAEVSAARAHARTADLLLATPTVDIGYNFERKNKDRQSLDFLYCDARFPDELVQRIGRAGRVLGKAVTNRPSEVVAVVPDALYQALLPYDDKTVSRAALAGSLGGLPHRHDLFAYVASGAIGEAFLPLYQLETMTSPDEREDVRRLYETIRSLFGGKARLTFDRLAVRTRFFLILDSQLHDVERPSHRQAVRLAEPFIADSEKQRGEKYTPGERTQILGQLKTPGSAVAAAAESWLDDRVRRYRVLGAPFHFRDAFQEPEALISDPRHLLGSSDVSRYGVLHVAANYHARFFRSAKAWREACGNPSAEGAEFFCALLGRRAPGERLRLSLALETADEISAWENAFCGRVTALHDLTLRCDQEALPIELVEGWRDRYVVALVLPDECRPAGQLKALARDHSLRILTLSLTSLAGGRTKNYLSAPGTAALFAEAELRRAIHAWQRQEATGGSTIIV